MHRVRLILASLSLSACPEGDKQADTASGAPCTPGMSLPCACTSGLSGAQVCAADGLSFEPCECATPPESSSGTDAPTTTAASTSTDASTGSSSATTGESTGLASTSGTCETTGLSSTTAAECVGPDLEPDSEDDVEFVEAPVIGCDDPPAQLAGVLDGATDVDWLAFFGFHSENGFCSTTHPDPHIVLSAGSAVRLCAFVACEDPGQMDVLCLDGAEPSTSPQGRPGCCAHGDVSLTFDCMHNLRRFSDNAIVLMRVDEAPPDTCVEYTLTYQY